MHFLCYLRNYIQSNTCIIKSENIINSMQIGVTQEKENNHENLPPIWKGKKAFNKTRCLLRNAPETSLIR